MIKKSFSNIPIVNLISKIKKKEEKEEEWFLTENIFYRNENTKRVHLLIAIKIYLKFCTQPFVKQ
jgi:hypothetical protein